MAAAAHLVDPVIPPVRVRQWVLSLVRSWRSLREALPEVLTPVQRTVLAG